MKKILLLCSVAALLFACGGHSYPKTTLPDGTVFGHFGEKINADDVISTADLVSNMNSMTSLNTKFSGTITQTCAKKGCWMSVQMPDGEDMTMTFKDYGFFVPTTGAQGRNFIAEGVCYFDTLSVDWLRHLADDAGKSEEEQMAITEPRFALAFEAIGVMIQE